MEHLMRRLLRTSVVPARLETYLNISIEEKRQLYLDWN